MTVFYPRLRDERQDGEALQRCIEKSVLQLETRQSTADAPGMLLGKIQSGKTRGFLGIIAQAFDRGYDVAIVLTKGTVTLSTQTVRRFARDYRTFVNGDEIIIFDIMEMPERLTRSELRRKIVIVAKKQMKNLERVLRLFSEQYPELRARKVLLVDDEADLASVRFVRNRESEEIEQGRIAQQMDNLRNLVHEISFLQVTATPYSLYLQPDTYRQHQQSNFFFLPRRPAFTELLPIHEHYVGGDDYFGDFADSDPRSYLFVEVPLDEQDALRSNDGRTVRDDRLYSSDNIEVLRRALTTFVVAVATRRWQQRDAGQPVRKYAMVIHNDTQKKAHEWQWDIVTRLVDAFRKSAETWDVRLRSLFDASYDDIERSVAADDGILPEREESYRLFRELLLDEDVHPERVNSDVFLRPLLDPETAELKLRAACNVFIGGSILDRGITIPNLIAFYYGRNPKRMQADTVLQHSRMYGARDRRDLAVTRFYTSRAVYDRLKRIHEFEVALRKAFEKGAHDRGVAFIRTDATRTVVPCAPSKVLLSNLISVRPGGRLLPVGFQSRAKSHIERHVAKLDDMVLASWRDTQTPTKVSTEKLHRIIDEIEPTFDIDGTDWDWRAFHAAIDFFSRMTAPDAERDGAFVLALTDRDISRIRESGRFQNAPDTKQQHDIAEVYARKLPMLLLFRINGRQEKGWGGYPFWWPVLIAPHEAAPVIYAAVEPDGEENDSDLATGA